MRWAGWLAAFALAACCGDVDAERKRLEEERQALHEQREAIERERQERRSGLKIDLPQGAAQEIDPSLKSLVIEVPAQGSIVVNGVAVDDTDLDNLFRRAFLDDKNTQVVIEAARGVAHGRVIGVMERAKAAGLSKLAVATSR